MRFTLTGPFKPYVRMTRRGKWASPQAIEYMTSQEALALQFKQQCRLHLPDQTPLAVRILIRSPKAYHHSDIDNQAKALIDAAQGIVFANDMWIDVLEVRREPGADYVTKFEVFPIKD